jgi:hypothetical protein
VEAALVGGLVFFQGPSQRPAGGLLTGLSVGRGTARPFFVGRPGWVPNNGPERFQQIHEANSQNWLQDCRCPRLARSPKTLYFAQKQVAHA